MRELREDTFSGNKNDDAHEYVERVLDIVSLFNIPGVTHDVVMLRVFPITLTRTAKKWVDKLSPRTIDSWDLLKKAFIQRYCPPSKAAKQLEEIRNFKKESDDTLHQAWERYNDLLYKCLTHDINSHQKWHNGSSSKNVGSSSNPEGIAAIVSKLNSLGRDMKKLKDNVHAIQVGCQTCGGPHLDKEFPLNEEVKSVEEVKYGEFGRPSPFNNGNGYKYRVEIEIKQLTKEFHAKTASEVPNSSVGKCKAVYANEKAPIDNTYSNETNELHEVSFIANDDIQVAQEEDDVPLRVFPCQIPPKELNLGSFTLPCTIESLNYYAMTDLVIDMLKTRNETMILGRPFLATIHVEIDVFNKEISLGIGDDRVTFDMDKKIHNFTTPVGKVYMVNLIHNYEPHNLLDVNSNASSYESPQFEKSKNLHHQNNNDKYMQERSSKKARMRKPYANTLSVHLCKPVKQDCKGILKVWPTCDPTMKLCNGGSEIYGVDEHGVLKYWYCYLDDERKSIKGGSLSSSDFFLAPPLRFVLRYKKIANLDQGTIPSRNEELGTKDSRSKSFDDYKWVFDLEIDQLANEYELGIGNKGHMLDDIWEYCEKVQRDNTYWWHDHGLEEDERQEIRVDIEEYDPPKVHVETFEVKRYSFDSGNSFISVTKENDLKRVGHMREVPKKDQGDGIRGDYESAQDMLVKSSSLAIIIRSTKQCSGNKTVQEGRTRALKQETPDLDVENKQMEYAQD
ncbi:hypothetical protein Tco_0064554 [Tanacetum coccineum]